MKKRILLEGKDDVHVVINLLRQHDLAELFDLKDKDGVDRLLDTFGDELEATDIDSLGVVLDADTDLMARWGRLSSVLTRAGYATIPVEPDPAGTIVQHDGLVPVGIWVMPNNAAVGALEDFVSSLITGADVLWPKARTDVAAIPAEHRRFKESFVSKACIHTWLAWQEQPGTRLGQVFMKKYLDPAHPNASTFVAWLRRLLAVVQQGAGTA